jgi:hypothetical protein
MKAKIILLVMLLGIMLAGVASAGSISMTVSTEAVFLPGNMSVSLQNNGDETAWNVHVSVLSIFEANDIYINSLGPGQNMSFQIKINKTTDILPGQYPAVILTRYEDANGYPFSSVSPNYVIYEEASISDVHASVQSADLAQEGVIKIEIRNLGNKEENLRVRLYLPLEINSDNEKNISIAPKSDKEVSFEMSNFGALVGSSYVVLAAVEYEDDAHYSTVATGIVRIVEESTLNMDLLIITLIILIVIFVAYQLKEKKTKEMTSNEKDTQKTEEQQE